MLLAPFTDEQTEARGDRDELDCTDPGRELRTGDSSAPKGVRDTALGPLSQAPLLPQPPFLHHKLCSPSGWERTQWTPGHHEPGGGTGHCDAWERDPVSGGTQGGAEGGQPRSAGLAGREGNASPGSSVVKSPAVQVSTGPWPLAPGPWLLAPGCRLATTYQLLCPPSHPPTPSPGPSRPLNCPGNDWGLGLRVVCGEGLPAYLLRLPPRPAPSASAPNTKTSCFCP